MKTALMLIDIQNDYFPKGTMELEGCLEASRLAGNILNSFREKGWPVVHIQHISIRPDQPFFCPIPKAPYFIKMSGRQPGRLSFRNTIQTASEKPLCWNI